MSSSSDSDSEYIVPNDHVALVLLEDKGSSFYLQVPLTPIRALCLKPLNYLLYLGWCILSAEGVLSLERDDHDGIDTDEDAVGGEIYYYVPAPPLGTFLSLHAGYLQHIIYLSIEDLAQVVDLDVIKARTNTTSESSATRDDFRTVVEERDIRCVWTGSQFGTVYTSSPLTGVLKYVPRLFLTLLYDQKVIGTHAVDSLIFRGFVL
jgi:hypothetical protein